MAITILLKESGFRNTGSSTSADSSDYEPSVLADWDSSTDPGNVDDALDQLAKRVKDIEIGTTAPDASVVTYTPAQVLSWNSSTDPGNVDDALDQLAFRVTQVELFSASDIEYTPTTGADWNSPGDPGQVSDALDELAERVKDIETGGEASLISYTPADNTDWLGNTDPGNVDDALDQLAARLDDVEAGTTLPDASGVSYEPGDLGDWGGVDPGNVDDALDELADMIANLDAGDIAYTPSTLANWNSSSDPGDADNALDQLASRIKTLEMASAVAAVKVSGDDTTPGFLEDKLVAGTGIALTTLSGGGNEDLRIAVSGLDADNVDYSPTTLSDWNSSSDPGSVEDGLDQLAARVKTIETATINSNAVIYTSVNDGDWNGGVDPGNVNDALDQLAERVKDIEAVTTFPDASGVGYSPADPTDWSPGPSEVNTALNQLANRVGELEDEVPDAAIVTYTPAVLADWDSSTDPGNVDGALDQLAARVSDIVGSSGAPSDAEYIVETSNGGLSAEAVLGTTVITRPTYETIPSAAKAGRLRFLSDSIFVARDNGSTYNYHGPIWPLAPVPLTGWTWVNRGSGFDEAQLGMPFNVYDPSFTATESGVLSMYRRGSLSAQITALVKARPTPPFTVVALVAPDYGIADEDESYCGLCLRNSTSGEIKTFYVNHTDSGIGFGIDTWFSATSGSVDTFTLGTRASYSSPYVWYAITCELDEGVNTSYAIYASLDGVNFNINNGVSGEFDEIGLFVRPSTVNSTVGPTCIGITALSWMTL